MNKNKNVQYSNLPIISKEKIIKNENLEQKSSKLLTIFLVIFIIILLLFCGYSMAKTIEGVIIKSSTQIAEPILVIENNPSLDITAANNYGEYIFKIKNYNEKNKVTDTDLKYYIEILSDLDESINIELYENDNKIVLDNNKTGYMEISKDKKQEKEYKIKVTYDKDKTNPINDIMEKIQVKVHTEQAKA